MRGSTSLWTTGQTTARPRKSLGVPQLIRGFVTSSAQAKHPAPMCAAISVPRKADAEFIVFLDSDDLLAPDCLGRRVEVMQRNLDLDFATFQTAVFEYEAGGSSAGSLTLN